MDCATNIFCGSRALQKFCRRVVAVNAILNVAKNNWNKECSDLDLQGKNRFGKSCLIFLKRLALYLAIIHRWQLSNSSH